MAVAPGVANPYAAGAKVYNGGSSAATSGPVDPTGYIDRELNNNQSYTPGVAAGALGVLKSNLSTDVQKNDTPPVANPVAATPTASTTTGAIGYNIPIPYDLQLKGIEANSNYQNLMLQLTAQRNAAAQNEMIGHRNLDINQKDAQRGDLNRAAYRGMARSSGYVQQVDRTAQNFNNQFADLESKFYQALNDAQASEVGGKAQYDSIMQAVQREAAARLAEKQTTDPNAGAIDQLPPDPKTQGTPDPNQTGGNHAPALGTPTAPKQRKPPVATTPKPAATHVSVVKAKNGETLQTLSKKYGIPITTLMKLNPGLKRNNGQWLVYSGSTIHLGSGKNA